MQTKPMWDSGLKSPIAFNLYCMRIWNLNPHTTGLQLDLTLRFNNLAVCYCVTWPGGPCVSRDMQLATVKAMILLILFCYKPILLRTGESQELVRTVSWKGSIFRDTLMNRKLIIIWKDAVMVHFKSSL